MKNLIVKTAVFLTTLFVLLSGITLCYAESKEEELQGSKSLTELKIILGTIGELVDYRKGIVAVPMLGFANEPAYNNSKIHPKAEDIKLQHDYYLYVTLYLYRIKSERTGSEPVYYMLWQLDPSAPFSWVEAFRGAGIIESEIENIKEGKEEKYEDIENTKSLIFLRILDKDKLPNYKEKKEESDLYTVATFYGSNYGKPFSGEELFIKDAKEKANAGEKISDYWLKPFAFLAPPPEAPKAEITTQPQRQPELKPQGQEGVSADRPSASDIAWVNGRRVRYYESMSGWRKKTPSYAYFLAIGDVDKEDFELYVWKNNSLIEDKEQRKSLFKPLPVPKKEQWKHMKLSGEEMTLSEFRFFFNDLTKGIRSGTKWVEVPVLKKP